MIKNFIITVILGSLIIFLGFGSRVFAPNGILPDLIAHAPDFFQKETIKEIKLLFVGDIMMDRNIRTIAEKKGYDFYFECAKPIFEKYDFVVANLEGPVTEYNSVSRVKTEEDPNLFKFTMSEKVLLALKNNGVDIVSIANNHIFDFGKEGARQTGENILAADLSYFGDTLNKDFQTLILTKNDINFRLIPFNEFSRSEKETSSLIEDNSEIFEIVFAHWGDEYTPVTNRIRKIAKDFIDKGADIIIGAHPHVLQEVEIYNEKPIFYSLGNFIFDQYWMESVRNGGAAEIVLKNNGEIMSRLLPVSLDSELRPCISE
jgi:gamma-polyglutamate biosynthesis protein CapA